MGTPESAMWVLSMWLMKKSRKVVSVSTNMRDEHVSLPKSKSQLAQLHDDEDVFATSVTDRYAARPLALQNICLAMKWLIFSSTEYIFPRPQAFASPSDMASSGVWENVFLATTPTFDGVCGMLWYIILDVYIAKFWHICHWLLICANFYWFFVTDVVVTCI